MRFPNIRMIKIRSSWMIFSRGQGMSKRSVLADLKNLKFSKFIIYIKVSQKCGTFLISSTHGWGLTDQAPQFRVYWGLNLYNHRKIMLTMICCQRMKPCHWKQTISWCIYSIPVFCYGFKQIINIILSKYHLIHIMIWLVQKSIKSLSSPII